MYWHEAEATIQDYIRTQWALTNFAHVPLQFENDPDSKADLFVYITVEGTFAEKSVYGSTGKRFSDELGHVFLHVFGPAGSGKLGLVEMVVTLSNFLELRSLDTGLMMEGANPPSPIMNADQTQNGTQPGGNYYRCSGSVPFRLIGSR